MSLAAIRERLAAATRHYEDTAPPPDVNRIMVMECEDVEALLRVAEAVEEYGEKTGALDKHGRYIPGEWCIDPIVAPGREDETACGTCAGCLLAKALDSLRPPPERNR